MACGRIGGGNNYHFEHADIIGDEALIRRAINIQDELILFHVEKMETALEDAARS